MTLQLGDKLILVRVDHRRGAEPSVYDVEVVKLGRRWATVQGGTGLSRAWPHERVDKRTLEVDSGDYSPDFTCYRDRQQWNEEVDRRELGQELRRLLTWGTPNLKHLSPDELRAIIAQVKGPHP